MATKTKGKQTLTIYGKQLRWQLLMLLYILSINNICKGQTPGNGDPNWKLDANHSDEFNYGIPNAPPKQTQMNNLRTKWDLAPSWGNPAYSSNPCHFYQNDDISNNNNNINFTYWNNGGTNDGSIELVVLHDAGNKTYPCQNCWKVDLNNPKKVTKIQKYYDYTGPQLISKYQTSKYGAFEIRFKLPYVVNFSGTFQGLPNAFHVAGGYSAFWMFPVNPPAQSSAYTEVDFFETTAFYNNLAGQTTYYDNRTPVYNSNGDRIIPNNGPTIWTEKYPYITNDAGYHLPDDGQWHVVTGEWNPDYMSVFLDGVSLSSFNWKQDMLDPMNILISNSINENCCYGSIGTTYTHFPYILVLDYYRLYKLNDNYGHPGNLPTMDNTNSSTNSMVNYGTSVYEKITIGGTTGSSIVTVPTNQKISLRATTMITLDEGFDCGTNAEFYAMVQQF